MLISRRTLLKLLEDILRLTVALGNKTIKINGLIKLPETLQGRTKYESLHIIKKYI